MKSKWSLHSIFQNKFEIMVYGKTKYYFTSPDFNSFWKTYWVYWSFVNHDLQMDLMHVWWILSFFFIFWRKFKMITICSNFISQRDVKAWIIANCIDFIIYRMIQNKFTIGKYFFGTSYKISKLCIISWTPFM
jgi:hypothetical protein